MPKKVKQTQPVTFAYALRSFIGYLEGTEKSAHTIESYRSDLNSFQDFLTQKTGGKIGISRLTLKDLEDFHVFLKTQSLRANTRRRKILTIRRFFKYLNKRKKIRIDIGQKLPAPYKVERVPKTISVERLMGAVRKLPEETEIQLRNKVLLWALCETGAQVSEIARVRFEDWKISKKGGALVVGGKNSRELPVTTELVGKVMRLEVIGKDSTWVFQGFNKFGPIIGKNGATPISDRGVELLVKGYGKQLGFPELTPRVFRRSIVMHWFKLGLSKEDIRKRLGLKTDYAFRVYDPLFKRESQTENSRS